VCNDLDALRTASLEGLSSLFGYDHSFVLVPDEEDKRLFTIASRGFPVSGVGSEVAIAEGIIGTAAAQRSPIRNANLARDMIYSRPVRSGIENLGDERLLQREIPLPAYRMFAASSPFHCGPTTIYWECCACRVIVPGDSRRR
jgi:adenylate cyclase